MPAKLAANADTFVKSAHIGERAGSLFGASLALWWGRWHERRRFARALPGLADEVLADYGLTRDEMRKLCRKPFWQA